MTLALIVGACTNLLAKQRGMINHHCDSYFSSYIVLITVIYDDWCFLHTCTTKDFYLITIHITHIFMCIIVFVYAYVHMCMYVCVYGVHSSVCCLVCGCSCMLVCVRVCVCMSVHVCVECLLAWYIIPYMTERCINANQHYIKHTNGPLCVNHKHVSIPFKC